MKIFTIAAVLFMFQVTFGLLVALGPFSTIEITPQQQWLDDMSQNEIEGSSYSETSVQSSSSSNFGFGDFIKGMFYFIKTIYHAVFSIGYTLSVLGVNPTLIPYISFPIHFMYFIGIAQFLANRNLPFMR